MGSGESPVVHGASFWPFSSTTSARRAGPHARRRAGRSGARSVGVGEGGREDVALLIRQGDDVEVVRSRTRRIGVEHPEESFEAVMAVGAGGSGSVHVGVVDSHHERHPTAAIHPIHLPAHNLRVCLPPTAPTERARERPDPTDGTPGLQMSHQHAVAATHGRKVVSASCHGVPRSLRRQPLHTMTSSAPVGSLQPPVPCSHTISRPRGRTGWQRRSAGVTTDRTAALEPVERLAPRRHVPHLPEARPSPRDPSSPGGSTVPDRPPPDSRSPRGSCNWGEARIRPNRRCRRLEVVRPSTATDSPSSEPPPPNTTKAHPQ